MPRPVRVSLSAVVSATFLLALGANACRAQLDGDPTLLKQAAEAYRTNLDRLQTWEGSADYCTQRIASSPSGHENVLIESKLQFAYDAKSGDYLYVIDIHKDASIRDSDERARFRPERRSGMLKGAAYYDLVFKTDNPSADRTAYIRDEKRLAPSAHPYTFEPLHLFTDQGRMFDAYLSRVHDNANNNALQGSVQRTDDLITFVRTSSSGVTIELVLDLSQGGNPVSLRTMEGASGFTLLTWEWEHVNRVWVPGAHTQIRAFTHDGESKVHNTTIRWTRNVVNERLSDRTFSLASLGLRTGDRVRDTRTGDTRVFEDSESPAARESQAP